ncbi:small RNA 2'-O-methyltransferase-like [Planococcus citri]|uniref:small RNA 2'-O-methyltransferase-like n=1 Tax=Planococcus citri TaxID=170843 RepID=UPI0031F9D771
MASEIMNLEVEQISGDKENTSLEKDESELSSNLSFNPPVYIQRYNAISDVLDEEWSRERVKKVIDFGCAEFKLFKHIKEILHITHICGVDLDKQLVTRSKYEARPLPFHYVLGFSHPLTVELFAGSIAVPDKRLLDANAVICIELIEHLYPDVLEKVPSTVFEFIQPELAVFTTPNADFNVLFNMVGFRHDDHKFEWTRKEFEDWCCEIINKYPYEVEYRGIGEGPKGTEHLGCCSQMAIFRRIDSKEKILKVEVDEPFELIETFAYPYKEDNRSPEEKFSEMLVSRINRVFVNKLFVSEEDDSKFEIPVDYLWEFMQEICPNLNKFLEILREKGYEIFEKDNGHVLSIIQEEENSDSDEYCDSVTSIEGKMDDDNILEENW